MLRLIICDLERAFNRTIPSQFPSKKLHFLSPGFSLPSSSFCCATIEIQVD